MNLEQSIKLVKPLVDIPIYNNNSDNTACTTYPLNMENSYININEIQLSKLSKLLLNRGYDKKYIFLQVLLHEICHYRQRTKYGREGIKRVYKHINFDNIGISKEKISQNPRLFTREKIADRYALRYYKRFIKNKVDKD